MMNKAAGRCGRLQSVALVGAIAVPGPRLRPRGNEATAGYTFAFPRDHASHPDYKIEWWYYTGNVKAADGRRFGYQVTFFRVGVDHAPANPSRWAVRDLFMTHLAVSDRDGPALPLREKLTRGGPGLAGAQDRSLSRLERRLDGVARRQRAATCCMRRASSAQAGIDLVLDEGKPPAINGINGISQKGAQAGNASHYYSLTRMPTRGTITDRRRARSTVTGDSWMDHEFGTSFLEPEQHGWDWLSIQLADGRELMLYQLRRADGTRDPRSSGTLVDRRRPHHAPRRRRLHAHAGTPARSRRRTARCIRSSGRSRIPSQRLELHVTTPLDDQELSLEPHRRASRTGKG